MANKNDKPKKSNGGGAKGSYGIGSGRYRSMLEEAGKINKPKPKKKAPDKKKKNGNG